MLYFWGQFCVFIITTKDLRKVGMSPVQITMYVHVCVCLCVCVCVFLSMLNVFCFSCLFVHSNVCTCMCVDCRG